MGYSEEAEHEHRDADDEHAQAIQPEVPADIAGPQMSDRGGRKVSRPSPATMTARATVGQTGSGSRMMVNSSQRAPDASVEDDAGQHRLDGVVETHRRRRPPEKDAQVGIVESRGAGACVVLIDPDRDQ